MEYVIIAVLGLLVIGLLWYCWGLSETQKELFDITEEFEKICHDLDKNNDNLLDIIKTHETINSLKTRL